MIKIYRDDDANCIFLENANGAQFSNSLQAITNSGNNINIVDLAKDLELVSNEPYSEFIDNNGVGYGNNTTEVVNALNTVFAASGTPTENAPVITSSLAVNLTQGETLNYELAADYGVGYEWDFSNVPGITWQAGNIRKIIGGSSLAVGTYNIPVKAINLNDVDSQTLVLTVATPPFANTKSVKFANQDWLGGNASQVDHVLGRSGNGSGSSDAWTIAFWYKASPDNQGQTIVYFGDNDTTNGGYIELRQTNQSGQKRLRFRYGSGNNYLQMSTAAGSLTPNTWQHIVITYDGGTTGSSSGSLSSYYSRFKIYIDNSVQTTSDSHSNYGWSSGIDPDNWRVGRFASGSHMRQTRLDELALFDSDQSANVATLYNSGVPFDLSTLTTQPKHWWRMGDGDIYPNLQDNGTEANCVLVMYNMTAADIVSDTP